MKLIDVLSNDFRSMVTKLKAQKYLAVLEVDVITQQI